MNHTVEHLILFLMQIEYPPFVNIDGLVGLSIGIMRTSQRLKEGFPG